MLMLQKGFDEEFYSVSASQVSNGGYGEELAFSPYRQNGDLNGGLNHQPHQSLEWESGPCSAESSLMSPAPQVMMEHHHIKSSKSMDLGGGSNIAWGVSRDLPWQGYRDWKAQSNESEG
ncbi:partitioning defective 3 homolog B isoform X1 [Tachysurus ichikawai]